MLAKQAMGIPVIIAHFGGNQKYLRLGLESAAKFNHEVVLIGDESNANLWGNHWNSDKAGTGKFREFMHGYVRMADYDSHWKRWFMIEAWMKSEGIKELFLTDSDVMSFADYSKEVAPLLPSSCRAALMTSHKQGIWELWSSPHFSYWTREALEDFTAFSINAYKDRSIRKKLEAKYQWHIDNNRPGGVCEMTLLHLWAAKNSMAVMNLAKAIKNSVADLVISESNNYFDDEYEMRGGFKKLVFRNGVPYGFNRILKQEIRFWCLHCQGGSKGVMQLLHRVSLRAFFPHLYWLNRFPQALKRKSKSYIKVALMGMVRGS